MSQKFTFNFTVSASDQEEAKRKMASLSNIAQKTNANDLGKVSGNVLALRTLATKLDSKTLISLAHVVNNQPAKVAMAKKFLGIS